MVTEHTLNEIITVHSSINENATLFFDFGNIIHMFRKEDVEDLYHVKLSINKKTTKK